MARSDISVDSKGDHKGNDKMSDWFMHIGCIVTTCDNTFKPEASDKTALATFKKMRKHMTKFEIVLLNMNQKAQAIIGQKREAVKSKGKDKKSPSSAKKVRLDDDSKSAGSKSSSQKKSWCKSK